jgi:hypothetical protein
VNTTIPAQYEVWVCKFRFEDDPSKLFSDRIIAWIIVEDEGVPPVPVGRSLGPLWNEEANYQMCQGPSYNEAIERAKKVIKKSGALSMGVRRMIEDEMSAYDVAFDEAVRKGWLRQTFQRFSKPTMDDIRSTFDDIARTATEYHQEWAKHAGPDAHGYPDKAVL